MKRLLIIFFFPLSIFAQSNDSTCATIGQINKLIQDKHYQPKPINDIMSVYVFNSFLEQIDSNNSLFTVSDINALKGNKLKLDTFILNQKCDFLDEFYTIYASAFARRMSIISEILKQPIVYSSKENIQFSKKRIPFATNTAELKQRYKKRILFEILSDIVQVSKNKDSINTAFKAIAENSKLKVFENYNCKSRNKMLSKIEFSAVFINSFCSFFDPHTAYFSSSEKSDFLSGLSSSNYSFGINMQINEKNEMSISDITPYGSAYFSNKIEVGDIIQKIRVNNTDYNMSCNNYIETDAILSANDTKKAIFTLRRKSGEVYVIELYKQLMRDYQNSVYSYILEYENKKTGYIKIPSFYSKFENGKTNVSEDFKKEILKLNDNNIKSLIIDLEDNGGGSLQEAISMCGFFITAPVVAQEKFAKNEKFLVANEQFKPIFNGSIAIIINGSSASASELFANAMQDYSMATIIGTNSYGKASIQQIFEIENKNKDFLKMTIGTFYRVTGKSHQGTGITPNIIIPSYYDDQIPRESSAKQALKNEVISCYVDSKSYPISEKQANVISKYKLESLTNPIFANINQLKKRVNNLFGANLNPINLNFLSVFDYSKTYNMLWKDLSDFSKSSNNIRIYSSGYETEKSSKILNNSNKIGVENIKTNVPIFESLKILGNMN